jgi:hypothetical protein
MINDFYLSLDMHVITMKLASGTIGGVNIHK